MAQKIKKIPIADMSHDEWLAERRKYIGGSDASALVGLNKYSSPYQVWADKLGKIPPKEDNEAMRQGRDLEQYVAERFMEATGKKVRRDNHIILNEDYPHSHANIDRMIVGENAGLECKTTNILAVKDFKGQEFPEKYYAQCMHYLMVTGLDRWYLAVLVLGSDFKVYCLERNEDEIKALADAENEFWEKYVATGEQPPVSVNDGEALSVVWSESQDGKSCDLTPLKSQLTNLSLVNKQIKELTDTKKSIENEIKSYMGDSEKGIIDGFSVSWKTQTRRTFDNKKFAEAHPDMNLEGYYKVTTSRPFKFS